MLGCSKCLVDYRNRLFAILSEICGFNKHNLPTVFIVISNRFLILVNIAVDINTMSIIL